MADSILKDFCYKNIVRNDILSFVRNDLSGNADNFWMPDIDRSIHDMVFLERHIQNRIYFIIFFDGRQQILLISCHTLCMAIPVYYILYFEGIPSKYFQAISLFPTLFPRIPPITTGNSVVIFPRNFDKFCHYFLLTPFFLQSSVLFSIYIIYLIISFYKELFTFST